MLPIPEDSNRRKALHEYLNSFLTDARKNRFEEVIAYRTRHFAVAVEDIFQEHNAGAVMRTCDCFGIQQLYVIENQNNYRASKAISKGAQKWVDVKTFRDRKHNTQTCIDHLRSEGYRIVATTPHTKDVLTADYDISQKSVFFFGTEGEGLSSQVLNQADAFIQIPMVGFTESFNISVSAAIILYALTERLRKSNSIAWQMTDEEKQKILIEWAIHTIPRGESIAHKFLDDH